MSAGSPGGEGGDSQNKLGKGGEKYNPGRRIPEIDGYLAWGKRGGQETFGVGGGKVERKKVVEHIGASAPLNNAISIYSLR